MAWQYAAMAGLQVWSSLQQAQMIKEQGKLNAEIAKINQDALMIDAFNAQADGMTQVGRYQNVIDSITATQDLAMAVSDIDAGFGTAAQIAQSSKVNALFNKMEITKAANNRARGIESQARNMGIQSMINRSQVNLAANATIQAGVMRAAYTGLNAVGKTGSTPSDVDSAGSASSSIGNIRSQYSVMEP